MWPHGVEQGRLVATHLRIDPGVGSDCGGEARSIPGQFRVGPDQLSEHRLRAVQTREGAIGFAAIPGNLREAEQLTGESVRSPDETWG